MNSEQHQKRALVVITWLPSATETCTCASCNYNNGRCGCEDYRRELVTRVRPGFSPPNPPEDVYIREQHSGGCLDLSYLPDGVTYVNPLPIPRAFGPRNRFEPLSAADALCLELEQIAAACGTRLPRTIWLEDPAANAVTDRPTPGDGAGGAAAARAALRPHAGIDTRRDRPIPDRLPEPPEEPHEPCPNP